MHTHMGKKLYSSSVATHRKSISTIFDPAVASTAATVAAAIAAEVMKKVASVSYIV